MHKFYARVIALIHFVDALVMFYDSAPLNWLSSHFSTLFFTIARVQLMPCLSIFGETLLTYVANSCILFVRQT